MPFTACLVGLEVYFGAGEHHKSVANCNCLVCIVDCAWRGSATPRWSEVLSAVVTNLSAIMPKESLQVVIQV